MVRECSTSEVLLIFLQLSSGVGFVGFRKLTFRYFWPTYTILSKHYQVILTFLQLFPEQLLCVSLQVTLGHNLIDPVVEDQGNLKHLNE